MIVFFCISFYVSLLRAQLSHDDTDVFFIGAQPENGASLSEVSAFGYSSGVDSDSSVFGDISGLDVGASEVDVDTFEMNAGIFGSNRYP